MQILLTKYWVLVHMIVLTGALLFIPDFYSGKLNYLIWGSLSLFLAVYLVPSVRKGENFPIARNRIKQALFFDVVFYLFIFLLIFLLVQLLNSPRELVFDNDIRLWSYSPPPVKWLPSSVDSKTGIPFFGSVLAVVAIVLVIRNALSRRMVLRFVIATLISITVLGVISCGMILFGDSNTIPWWSSSLFTFGLLHLFSVTVLFGIFSKFLLLEKLRGALGIFLLILLNSFFVIESKSILLICLLVLFSFLFIPLIFFFARLGRFPYYLAFLKVVFFVGIFAVGFLFLPNSAELQELFDMENWSSQLNAFLKQWNLRTSLCMSIWNFAPVAGCGFGAFSIFSKFYLSKGAEWRLFNEDVLHASTDFLQFLTEIGILGYILLLLPVAAILGKCLLKWVTYKQDFVQKGYSFHSFPIFIGAFLGMFVVLLGSLITTPLHNPVLLFVTFSILGCMPYWMPVRR